MMLSEKLVHFFELERVEGTCRCVFDGSPVRGASRRGEKEEAIGRGVTGTGSHELPNIRPRNGSEILHAAIIHYKATCVRLK
jgi:hypothetical protein